MMPQLLLKISAVSRIKSYAPLISLLFDCYGVRPQIGSNSEIEKDLPFIRPWSGIGLNFNENTQGSNDSITASNNVNDLTTVGLNKTNATTQKTLIEGAMARYTPKDRNDF